MADEYGFDVEIGMDIAKAIKNAEDLGRKMAVLGDRVEGSSKEFDKFEKAAIGLATGLQEISKGGKTSVIALNQQAKAAQDSAVSVGRLIDQMDKLRAAQRAQAGQGTAKTPFLDAEAQYKNRAAQAAAANKQMIADEKKVRATELGDLRRDIEARAAIERTARAEITKIHEKQARDAMALTKRRTAEEAAALKVRLAQEKKTAAEIDAVWKKAHEQNAVRNATKTANAAGSGGAALRGADPFVGLRESAAYTEMLDRSVQGLANQRYALYDVATTFGLVSVATLGAAAAAVKLGGDYEQAFQQVARTTGLMGPELEEMRHALVGLSTDIPVAFADIAEIATLGAQLNIANDNLDGFTKTVAQFAATTDVTVNAAAMGFGRLAQLTQTPQAEIDRLGSAIYEVGVNSVATESEILAVSQQIATAGNLAGFTNTEVVALASTLASLGVAPEQSRGAIMRVFGDITAAVGEGGDKLQAFARTSNMTSQQFAQAWRDSPQEAFNAYIAGLERVIKTNGDLDTSLKNQGFRNIRDRNVLTRLANNTEVYAAALDDTSRAYKENTALSEGAAIANDNLVDKLTVLMNTAKAVMAEVGQSDALKGLVDMLAAATEAILNIVQTPVGKAFAGLVLGIGAAIGAVAALAAGAAMGRAALLAIITALYNGQRATAGTTLGLKALTVELLRVSAIGRTASATMNTFRGSATAVNATLATTGVGARSAAGGMVAAAAGSKALAVGLKGILAATGVGLAITALTTAIEAFSYNTATAGEQAEKFFGDLSGLSSALQGDTATWKSTGEAISTFSTELETTTTSLNAGAQGAQNWTGQQVAMNDATSTTTEGVMAQTFAVGELTKQWALNALTTGEAGDQLVAWFTKYQNSINGMNLDFGDIITKALDPSNGGAEKYIDDLITKQYELTESYNTLVGPAQRVTTEARANIDALQELKNIMGLTTGAVTEAAARASVLETTAGALGIQLDTLDESAEGAADSALSLADGLSPLVDALFGTVNAAAATQQSLNDLGASLGENGNSFSEFSAAGRDNLAALNETISAMAAEAGDDTAAFITNVGGLLQQLEGMGVNVQGELGFVGEMLGDLTNQQYGINLDTSVARGSIAVFVADAIKALQVVAALEKRQAASLKAAGASVPGMGALGAAGALLSAKNKASGSAVDEQIKGLQQLQVGLAGAGRQGNQAGQQIADGFNKGAAAAKKAGGAGKKAGKDAAQGAKEIRTLLDYANDIESVFNRSFEIRFGVDQAADSAADALDKMKQVLENADKAIVDANEGLASTVKNLRDARVAVEEFNAEIQSLQADNKILDYQLNIAVKYGDDLRATDIRAKMAENAVELTKTEYERADAVEKVATEQRNLTAAEKAVAKAQADALRSLDGTTASSREQRAAVLALVQSYQGQIQAMASSGASTEELQRKTDQLEAEFRAQMTQMGYSRAETDKYAQSFRDLSVVLANVPRNVTVTANTNPAIQALNEFIARTNNSSATVGVNANINGGGSGGFSAAGDQAGKAWGRAFLNATARTYELAAQGMIYPGNLPFIAAAAALRLRAQYLSTGGVAGMGFQPKGTDTQPAMLTPGEYVVKKSTVDRLGIPFMNSLNNMQMPIYRAQGGSTRAAAPSAGGNGVQLVELLPTQLQQLAQMVKTSVYLDGKEIADATNSYNTQGATRGIR